jgi:hypothetical protein
MQIRKIGPQPADQFSLLPNALARDARLSFRARGVMAYINSHADGFHLNADSLAREGTEGRDAVRTAMNELIECGYLRRVRHQDEDGQWRTDINVYIYGDAPDLTGPTEPVATEDFEVNPQVTPTTVFQSSVSQSSVSQSSGNQSSVPQAVIEDQEEDNKMSPSVDAAGDPSEVPHQQQPVSQVVTAKTFPIVEQRKLIAWFGVVAPSQGEAWEAAWATACSITSDEVYYEPQAHLAIYLSKCREERRQPRSDLWLRFFIEDRAKHIQVLREESERHARQDESPQEREDRLNRRQPPADWGVATPVETGTQA